MAERSVFFVSDGTGITAETFGNSILAQFDFKPRHVRLPFVDTPSKARDAVQRINATFDQEGKRPIVFTTLVNEAALDEFRQCRGLVMDMFGTFVKPLELELELTSSHRIGRFGDVALNQDYQDRIEAINYSLAHDDGQSARNLDSAAVILVGVSRSGKTPTSLYLAMQHGIKAANYPLTPDDFERKQLPQALLSRRGKLFGLSIDPQRLAQIRNERRPDSR
ncbi:MAG: kinase/pyrophosphorylase, partial [Betaproteobacteria bacterium]|nr:kinase/pyrophosphorylase [Betaproteobacteria bacterium]